MIKTILRVCANFYSEENDHPAKPMKSAQNSSGECSSHTDGKKDSKVGTSSKKEESPNKMKSKDVKSKKPKAKEGSSTLMEEIEKLNKALRDTEWFKIFGSYTPEESTVQKKGKKASCSPKDRGDASHKKDASSPEDIQKRRERKQRAEKKFNRLTGKLERDEEDLDDEEFARLESELIFENVYKQMKMKRHKFRWDHSYITFNKCNKQRGPSFYVPCRLNLHRKLKTLLTRHRVMGTSIDDVFVSPDVDIVTRMLEMEIQLKDTMIFTRTYHIIDPTLETIYEVSEREYSENA